MVERRPRAPAPATSPGPGGGGASISSSRRSRSPWSWSARIRNRDQERRRVWAGPGRGSIRRPITPGATGRARYEGWATPRGGQGPVGGCASSDVRASRHERQRAHRHLLLLRRPGAARRRRPGRTRTAGASPSTRAAAPAASTTRSPAPIPRSRASSRGTRSRAARDRPHSPAPTAAGSALENTHPFIRELWGRHWTFAHNGQLRGVKRLAARPLPPDRHHRQRARLLLAARTGCASAWPVAPAAAPSTGARRRRCAASCAASASSTLLTRRPDALRPLRPAALLPDPARALRHRDAGRRGLGAWISARRRRPTTS